ncbi:TetR/AcrR family transcriptional regulator [Halomonas sp. KO116]|uniref:TetR/AcrR family transcriptional regulator n=1 Tax=Halomonas sp. KO116 TaxID=1504981 RepID=UPI0004E31D65|nr:TetR/AcrR family transcriptional regulator [Halomonas sp. KO116]AJY52347.1 transcriptional regulator, TetR family [Halomonas sp. KO116]
MSETSNVPQKQQDTQKAILDAAEAVFADNGFEGATTRAIAEKAETNSALIHYYFRNKESLFMAVVTRRSGSINERRRCLKNALFADGGRPELEELLDAFLRPTIELGRDEEHGGHNYARLLVHVASGMDERSRTLTSAQYNPAAREFIDAILSIVPGLSRKEAAWGYLQGVAVALSLMARTDRASELSDGECHDDDVEEVIARARTFIAGGIRALADQ